MNPVIPARNISPKSVLESSEGHLATTNYKNGVQLVRSLGILSNHHWRKNRSGTSCLFCLYQSVTSAPRSHRLLPTSIPIPQLKWAIGDAVNAFVKPNSDVS